MEIKFHTKPTQINRQNPIFVKDTDSIKVYAYPLKGDFYAKFVVIGSVAKAFLAECKGALTTGDLNVATHTAFDIHTKNNLVEFVTSYSKLSATVLSNIYNYENK